MKVERQKAEPTFEPIVITLETEEEASHLWHKLNSGGDWTKYRRDNSLSNDLDYPMWLALDDVFHVTDRC